jgi:hypothetical protein
LRKIGCLTARKAAEQLQKVKSNGVSELINDGRGGSFKNKLFLISFNLFFKGKFIPSFYEYFPEMEFEAKAFVEEETQKTECTFNVFQLANHINEKYKELTNSKMDPGDLIRSESILRMDLKLWGYNYVRNSKRAFYKGHENDENIEEREKLVDYFIDRIRHYYLVDENNLWKSPDEKPCVIFFQDESTFRNLEQHHSRWLKKGEEPFLSKGYF